MGSLRMRESRHLARAALTEAATCWRAGAFGVGRDRIFEIEDQRILQTGARSRARMCYRAQKTGESRVSRETER